MNRASEILNADTGLEVRGAQGQRHLIELDSGHAPRRQLDIASNTSCNSNGIWKEAVDLADYAHRVAKHTGEKEDSSSLAGGLRCTGYFFVGRVTVFT